MPLLTLPPMGSSFQRRRERTQYTNWGKWWQRARTVQKEDRCRSGSGGVVIVEHSTEALAPMHRVRWRDDGGGLQELVCEALMIAFSMVVRHTACCEGNRLRHR
jgi:hypothetical protein